MTKRIRFASAAAAVMLVCLAAPLAHPRAQSGASAQPTFRSSTTLVEFTLVAEDRDGNPVTDLRQDEIQIVEGKQPRDIAFFRFEGNREAPHAPVATLPKGIFSNRPEYTPGPPRNITAIVIDAVNTAAQDQLTVRSQVMRYLNTITPDTRVALYRAGERMEVLHDFTSDIKSLRARFDEHALEAPTHTGVTVTVDVPNVPEWQLGQPADSADMLQLAVREQSRLNEKSNQQIQDVRSRLTLHSLEILGNHLAAIPGRKSVVWITPGTPMTSMGAADKWVQSYETAVRNLARRMATQGITLYPVESFGIRPPDLSQVAQAPGVTPVAANTVAARLDAARAMANEATERASPTDERRLPSAMETLAEVTGGRIIRNTNDLTDGMKAAAADLRAAYSVGFYVPQNPDNQWHPFDVRISRPGVKLIRRLGYLGMPDHKAEEWLDEDWRNASNNPLGSTAIRLDARCTLIGDTLNVIMQIPGDDLQFRTAKGKQPTTELDVALAEKTKSGLLGVGHQMMAFQINEGDLADLSQVRVRFPKDWPLKHTTEVVRLIVRDRNSDKYGTIDVKYTDLIR